MTVNISVEKVKELIRLAERARADPTGRADDPQRGGPSGDEGVTLPATPPEPQPAADLRAAFERYLEDLRRWTRSCRCTAPVAEQPARERTSRRGHRAPMRPTSTVWPSSPRGRI